MRLTTDTEEAAEERRLWADFYEATARALELIRREGTAGEVISRIAAEDALARQALTRIKRIRGIP